MATADTNFNKRNESSRTKQSKSRSGCITCKKKRIKCDEAKPTCGQCDRRKLECDGYKLRYKWLSFDDTTKPPPKTGNHPKRQNTIATSQVDNPNHGQVQIPTPPTSLSLDGEMSWSPGMQPACTYAAPSVGGYLPLVVEDDFTNSSDQLNRAPFDLLFDLELGSNNSNMDTMSAGPSIAPSQYSGSYDTLSDEEAIRDWAISVTPEAASPRSRIQASSQADSQDSMDPFQSLHMTPFHSVYLDHSSPEMLLLRFDTETCGILSIKDGFAENPWRTVVRPLAKGSDVLCHAISAMAALHGATTQPRLRLVGMTHKTKAINKLSAEMHNMSENHILATALALCISEGWDDRISTGIKHLGTAKTILSNALARRSRSIKLGQLNREDAVPLKFLSNTFVYLDAIGRLTSNQDYDSINLDHAVQAMSEPIDTEIDPLMGCATTLFPLLGKVASLVHKVRKTSCNSLSIIGEANELREQLLRWEPPDMSSFKQPQDHSCNVRHVLQTAEAYRRAILLHLHSAVTELSSESSHDQAKSTLAMLAATPISSRTMIVQIFPLLVGSCEMVELEDRQWVTQRWDAMMNRLTLVNVYSCWKIVKEVWRRRDQWIETQPRQTRPGFARSRSSGPLSSLTDDRNMSGASSVTEEALIAGSGPGRSVRLPRNHTDVSLLGGGVEYTVRGQLHWLGVMTDWNWEVFL